MPLAQIKELKNINAGLYAIGNDEPATSKRDIKIGRSIVLKQRLNNYHICFPYGYFIYAVLPINAKMFQTKKALRDFSRQIENEAFYILQFEMIQTTTRTFKHEWFNITLNRLYEVFNTIHMRYPDATLCPIVKWVDNYVDEFDVEGEKMIVDRVKGMPVVGNKTKSGRTVKKNKKFDDFFFIN